MTKRHVFRLSFHFGLFQALMPALGWSVGSAIHGFAAPVDHWLALAILVVVGGKMIRAGLRKDGSRTARGDPTKGWDLVLLSLATSIDALAVGVSLAMMGADIGMAVLVFGAVAAGFTAGGMFLGRRLGALWGRRVEIAGGAILVLIGVRIVISHVRA